MDKAQRIIQLKGHVDGLIDLLASGELETSFEGEAVKFADASEIGRRIKMLRKEISSLEASIAGARHRKIRGIKQHVRGDN